MATKVPMRMGSRPDPAGVVPRDENLRQRIAGRAYELYMRRGRTDGRAMDDWLEAERQVLEEAASRSALKPGASIPTAPPARRHPGRQAPGATS